MPFKYSQDMRKFHENMMRENFLFQDDATCQACVVFEEKLAGVLKCSVVNLVIQLRRKGKVKPFCHLGVYGRVLLFVRNQTAKQIDAAVNVERFGVYIYLSWNRVGLMAHIDAHIQFLYSLRQIFPGHIFQRLIRRHLKDSHHIPVRKQKFILCSRHKRHTKYFTMSFITFFFSSKIQIHEFPWDQSPSSYIQNSCYWLA